LVIARLVMATDLVVMETGHAVLVIVRLVMATDLVAMAIDHRVIDRREMVKDHAAQASVAHVRVQADLVRVLVVHVPADRAPVLVDRAPAADHAEAHHALAVEEAAVAASILANYDCLLADLDGVVYEGTLAIDGAVDAINRAQAAGLKVGYVTNNSSRKPETIADQLAGFGLTVSPDEVISSGQTGVELLATMIEPGSRVLVVGGEGLRKRVVDAGFELVESSLDKPAGVIQGFAPDVAWKHLAEAAYSIQGGAKWVATNSDWTLPQERGLAPGNGTLVSAVHTAVGILPAVAGKPEPAIFATAVKAFSSSRPLFIGDRIDTDIVGANRAGIDSGLVLTGVSTRKELLGIGVEGRPTYILENLREIHSAYVAPKPIKYGYACDGARVELLAGKVRVTEGDARSFGALKAACAVIWNSATPIYGLDVEPALYE
jgi:HAD superfamily hydrolase (TIGR01450 family)